MYCGENIKGFEMHIIKKCKQGLCCVIYSTMAFFPANFLSHPCTIPSSAKLIAPWIMYCYEVHVETKSHCN